MLCPVVFKLCWDATLLLLTLTFWLILQSISPNMKCIPFQQRVSCLCVFADLRAVCSCLDLFLLRPCRRSITVTFLLQVNVHYYFLCMRPRVLFIVYVYWIQFCYVFVIMMLLIVIQCTFCRVLILLYWHYCREIYIHWQSTIL